MDGLEQLAYVLRSTALGAVYLEATSLSCVVEAWLGICCGQSVEEAAKRLGYAVINLIA